MEQQDTLALYHKVLEMRLYHGALLRISELWEISRENLKSSYLYNPCPHVYHVIKLYARFLKNFIMIKLNTNFSICVGVCVYIITDYLISPI